MGLFGGLGRAVGMPFGRGKRGQSGAGQNSLMAGGLGNLFNRRRSQQGQQGQAGPGAASFSPAQIDQGLQSFRGQGGLRQRPQMMGGSQLGAPQPGGQMPGASPQLAALPSPDEGLTMPTQPSMPPNPRPSWRQGRQDPGFTSFGGGWGG